jgi:predicted  nucleic acid-binding Zn-ribbon protein
VSGLEALAQLQDLDVHLAQLQYRVDHLPEVAARAEVVEAIEVLSRQRATIEEQVHGLQREQRRREDEVASLDERIVRDNDTLYGGGITSPKDAAAMQDEIASLGRRKGALEDEIIGFMEQVEPLDAELAALAEQNDHLTAQLADLDARIGEATAEVDGERSQVQAERDDLVAATSGELVELYERHRTRMGDRQAVGRLVGAACGACHLEISAVDLDHIRSLPAEQPGECPECGALLVHG